MSPYLKALVQIWSAGQICLAMLWWPCFKLFITCLPVGLNIGQCEWHHLWRWGCPPGPIWVHPRADMGAREGWYGFTWGLIWVHVRADIGSREWVVMDLESRISTGTKLFATFFLVKQVGNKRWYNTAWYNYKPTFEIGPGADIGPNINALQLNSGTLKQKENLQ